GPADNTYFQDSPPSVVLKMALASNTQVFVLKTAAALLAQPFSRSIICSESNSSAGDSCAGFGPETSSPRATFEQPSKAPLEMIAIQTSILGFIVSTTDRLQCRPACHNFSDASIPANATATTPRTMIRARSQRDSPKPERCSGVRATIGIQLDTCKTNSRTR